MSSAVANRLFLPDSDLLKPGMKAAVVIVDPATVADRATFDDPHQLSTGARDVWVNSTRVLTDSEHTEAMPWRWLPGPAYSPPA